MRIPNLSFSRLLSYFILFVTVFSILGNTALALSDADLKSIYNDTTWYKADIATGGSSTDPSSTFCLGGPGGSGPLYGPFFPKVSDTAALAASIKDYISNTRPDSPLADYANDFVASGLKYNVNPAMIVGITQQDTSLGTAGYGRPPKYNVGNIRGGTDGTGFNTYPGYKEGIDAIFALIAGGQYLGPPSNDTTVKEVIYTYAPPSDNNDTAAYVEFVGNVMKKILANLPADNGVDTTSDCTTGTSGIGAGDATVFGTGPVAGYVFPVAPQSKKENGGVPNMSPLPCLSPTSCHHDGTPAFDISRQPGGDSIAGTPVYAISAGKISNLHIYNGNAGCYSLQLHSSKDNFWYWYGHIQNVLIKSGDTVKAGQQLAEIGVRSCTDNGSDSHLHIDRGCVINGIPQTGGRESCRDPGIVPIINTLFEQLP